MHGLEEDISLGDLSPDIKEMFNYDIGLKKCDRKMFF